MSRPLLRPIPDFPGYSVTQDGRVWSSVKWRGTDGRWMSPYSNRSGHLRLSKPRVYIHRAVLLAWVGPCPEGMEALHGDGDPTNNQVSNLRWGTRSENHLDAIRHGTHPHAKLTDEEVRCIRNLIKSGASGVDIATMYGVSKTTISHIATGKVWAHVE